jgi:hypothetical protein
MKSVKGQGTRGRPEEGQIACNQMFRQQTGRAPMQDIRQETMGETMEDWANETPESEQLRHALIESGRAAMPRHDPARLERVFRRIMAQLEEERRDGVPAPRLDSPSGVTAKTFG